jgi:hypothetical protein
VSKGTVVIVLGLAVALAGCGGNGGNGGGNSESATVKLSEQNGSGESGTATLTAVGEKTRVVVDLEGEPASASQPAHIHKGSCDKLDPTPAFALPNIAQGKSETTVAEPLDDLKDEACAINVHKSTSDLKTYVACGDIGKGDGGGGGGGTGY